MNKSYIQYKNDISIEEVDKMIKDLDDLFALLEHFNEVLSYKQKQCHPVFGMFLRAIHINNCNTITASLKMRGILDKMIDDYFNQTEEKFNGKEC